MKSRHYYLYLIALLLAVALRFIQLGAIPLNDIEATWALQALSVAQGGKPLLGEQPGYILLTSLSFYSLQSTNFLARFWPAFVGSFIVFLPYFIRKKLGERVALIAAFLLAISPGLVAVSRQANGTILALTFGVFAWGMWQNDNPKWAGIFAGIALLGGPAVWMGVLSILLTWAVAQNLLPTDDEYEEEASPNRIKIRKDDLKVAAIFMGGTILLVSTGALLVPNGLSAWFASLVDYFSGWRFASGVPTLRILSGLLVYCPLALFFGIIAIIRGIFKTNRFSLRLGLWSAIALTLTLLYPARQVSDLIWAALPLWILSAKELDRYLHLPTYDCNETFGVFALTFILLVFAWINLASAGVLTANTQISTTHQLLLAGSIGLLILSLALIAFGWSVEVATLGGVWGIALGLVIYTLGVAWGSTGLRTPKGVELWDSTPRVAQSGLLLETIEEVSTWSRGDSQTLNITVNEINSPALRWALRNYTINEVASIDFTTAPELVITTQTEDIALNSAYRGQDFVWRQYTDWLVASSSAKWMVLRDLPQASEQIILWVRNDLFFDSQNQGTGINESVEQEAVEP